MKRAITFDVIESGPDAPRVYECANCGRWSRWTEDHRWYGSYRDLDNRGVAGIEVSCSDECRRVLDAERGA